MISAFGIDHGISKQERGWTSQKARKRTYHNANYEASVFAGHGNAQRAGTSAAVGAGLGAVGLKAAPSLHVPMPLKLPTPKRYKMLVGAGGGALAGLYSGVKRNKAKAMEREMPRAKRRGDYRALKPGERTTPMHEVIVPDTSKRGRRAVRQ